MGKYIKTKGGFLIVYSLLLIWVYVLGIAYLEYMIFPFIVSLFIIWRILKIYESKGGMKSKWH